MGFHQKDGYYWCQAPDGTLFIALREDGHWWTFGVENPILLGPESVLYPAVRPDIPGGTKLVEVKQLH